MKTRRTLTREDIEKMDNISTGGFAYKFYLADGTLSGIHTQNAECGPLEFYDRYMTEFVKKGLVYLVNSARVA